MSDNHEMCNSEEELKNFVNSEVRQEDKKEEESWYLIIYYKTQ